MRACALLALILAFLWVTQTVLLVRAGLPVRLRLHAADLPRSVKQLNRALTYVAFALALIVYPLLLGRPPLEYYLGFFPPGFGPVATLRGAAAAVLYLVLLYLAWVATGNVQFEVRHRPPRLLRKLVAVPPAAAFIALAEELLFRGVVLADLLRSYHPGVALPVGVLIFAGAHYVRSVKRRWTFPGHLALGTLFCVAFYRTDALWLPVGLHAGGILVLGAVRPFVRYTGPAWLVGASIFPYAGVVGAVALLLLTLCIWSAGTV